VAKWWTWTKVRCILTFNGRPMTNSTTREDAKLQSRNLQQHPPR
jgi:hypothetical protein